MGIIYRSRTEKMQNGGHGMEIGDSIKIKNSVGILTIVLDKKLKIRDVNRCMDDDALPSMEKPRWEFHKTASEEIITTLYNSKEDNTSVVMYVAFLGAYNKTEVWKAHIIETKQKELIYHTIYDDTEEGYPIIK